MAKKQSEIRRFPEIYTFKQPNKPKPSPYRFYTPTCGNCGADAEWEVYDTLQPHCTKCKDEAITSIPRPFVRELGGFDDAS